MATSFADALFWVASVAILLSQAFILRSTRRGMRRARRRGPARSRSALEWAFAMGPAVVLVAVLLWTRSAMHPGRVNFRATTPPATGMRS